MEFKPFLRFRPNFQNQNTEILSEIMENYSARNLNSTEFRAKLHVFQKNQNFTKSERFDGFFPNSIPSVIEH